MTALIQTLENFSRNIYALKHLEVILVDAVGE